MHDTKDRSRLYEAAEYIIGRLNDKVMDPRQTRGYLQVYDANEPNEPLLTAFIGTPQPMKGLVLPKGTLERRIFSLTKYFHEGGERPKCVTGSQLNSSCAGGVLIEGYAFTFVSSKYEEDGLGDEAISLLIALKAGLLGKGTVRSLFCTQEEESFNPHLRLLMSNITWIS